MCFSTFWEKTFKCSQCEATCSRKSDLNRHIATVHEGKKFKCPFCDVRFTRMEKIKNRISKVHEGKKAFQCSICNAMFSKLSNFTQHFESVHEGNVTNYEEIVPKYEEKTIMKDIKLENQNSSEFSLQNEDIEAGSFAKNEESKKNISKSGRFAKFANLVFLIGIV